MTLWTTTYIPSIEHAKKVSWSEKNSKLLNAVCVYIDGYLATNIYCRKFGNHGINTTCTIFLEPKLLKIAREPFFNRNGPPKL